MRTHLSLKSAGLGWCVLYSLSLAGCASLSGQSGQAEVNPVQYTFDSSTVCPGLERLLASAENQFSDISGKSASGSQNISVWQTSLKAENADCRIVEWGNGQPNYLCTVALPGEQSAQNWHQSLQATLTACLGPDWLAQDAEDREGIVTSLTRKEVSPSVITVRHYRNEKMLSSRNWTGVFSIGRMPSTP